MDTKIVSLTAIFSALAIALNPAISRISVPAPFFPLLPYQVWEIPIVIVLLLIGPKPAVLVGLTASIALVAFSPTYIAFTGILACLAMLTGAYLAYRLINRNVPQEKTPSSKRTVVLCTVGAIIFRTLIMAIQNYTMLPLTFSESTVIAIMPLVALFNATEPLYVIPIGYYIAKAIGKNLKVGNQPKKTPK